MRGRVKILEVHLKKIRYAPGLDVQRIAARTPGFSGADLANLVNEAALLAARYDHEAGRSGRFRGGRRSPDGGDRAPEPRAQRRRAQHRRPSRGRARAGRGPRPARRSGPQDHHHSARHGIARLHDAAPARGQEPAEQARARGSPGGAPRRARRRGAHLRPNHDRSAQRHRAREPDRAPHGLRARHERAPGSR